MRYNTDFITSLFFVLEVKQTAYGSSFNCKPRFNIKFTRFIWNTFFKNHKCKIEVLNDN